MSAEPQAPAAVRGEKPHNYPPTRPPSLLGPGNKLLLTSFKLAQLNFANKALQSSRSATLFGHYSHQAIQPRHDNVTVWPRSQQLPSAALAPQPTRPPGIRVLFFFATLFGH
eukprot:7836528-Pyramimonas_sp.AAC.3